MVFARRTLPVVLVAAALGLVGLRVAAGAGGAEKEAPATKTVDAKAAASKNQSPEKKSEPEKPACMHCGATCGLMAVCVCKPGTRKTQQTEYEATCDPICVPCCSGPPWPWGVRHRPACCTGCETECHDAWVRQRKKLVVEKKDEEKPTIERKVAWVCRACDPDRPVSCTGGGAPAGRRPGWWPTWLPHP
jgi:hypothetical protein